MRVLISLFLLIFFQLHSEEKIRLAAESEPLLTVANCVNVADGSFFQADQDLVVEGPIPLSYTRHYDSGDTNGELYLSNFYGYGVGLGCPMYVKDIEAPGNNQYLYVDQRHRYGVPFRYVHAGKKISKAMLNPAIYDHGYTNCTEALERGQPCLSHAELLDYKSKKKENRVYEVNDADGTKRTYTFYFRCLNYDTDVVTFNYILRKTEHPNGLTTHYEYDTKGRLYVVALKNSADNELLTWLIYNYDDQNNKYSVTASDGRTVYHDMSTAWGHFDPWNSSLISTSFLMGVSADHLSQKSYFYATSNGGKKTYPLLCKIVQPNGYYIFANYKDQKVRSLSATLQSGGSAQTLYTFDYKKEKTIVANALGLKYEYCFSHKRLRELKEGSARVRGYVWSDNGQLKQKHLSDPKRYILEAVLFHYDKRGNISQKWECGNITGDSPDSYSSKHKFKAGEDNVRIYSYTYGPFCNVVEEKNPNGTITTYSYKTGTNLPIAKFISSKGTIQEREFYDYDKNGILIQKVEDDGSGQHRNDLSNVTYWLVTRFHPQMDRNLWGWTKPAVEEKYYFDFSSGQEVLLERKEIDYARGGLVAAQRVYDATGTLAYEESFKYNHKMLVEEAIDRAGRVSRYGYDVNLNVILEELVGSGKKIYKRYDLANRLVEEKEVHDDGTVLTTSYTYDVLGNRTSMTDPEGSTTNYVYDEYSRKIKEIDPFGYEVNTVYDLKDNPVAITDKEGNTTRTKFNIDHQPLKIDYPDGTVEQFKYYVDGTLKSKIEKDGTSIGYTYDYRGRILTESRYDQKGHELTKKSYLYKGANLVAEIDPEGYVTHYTYDNAKRLIAKAKEGIEETYGYDEMGRQSTTTKGGRVTQKVFDVLDQVIEERIEDLDGNVYRKTGFVYDIQGNLCGRHVYVGEKIIETSTVYNSRNFPVAQMDGEGNQTTISYNHRPFQKIVVDPLGQVKIETYDALFRETSVEVAGLSKQEVVYSPNGHRIKQIDHIYQQGVETGLSTVCWEYNSVGNLLALVEQDLKETRHTYLDGRLDTTIKPDGVVLYHVYDSLGKLIEQKSSDGALHAQYTYDLNGNMLSAVDKIGRTSVERSYDPHNNITTETTHTTLSYSYDELDRVVQIRFPESTINYTYNPVDLVTIARHHKTHSYRYDLAGRLLQENTFDGTTTFYSYDDNHRLTAITSPFYTQSFLYDAVGNIISTTTNDQTTVYTYDGLYQLTSENATSYTYDSLYNRLSKNSFSYQHNTLHQVLSDHENIYTYDANGNRTAKNGINYTYDALNRLTSAGEITYTYDALGRLQTRISATSKEAYLYFKDNDLGTLDNMRILGKGMAAIEKEGKLYSVIRDHRGSPSVILCDAYPVATYTYNAFGETSHTGAFVSPWQYSAHRCDADTGLLHAPKRIYDPYIGRWLTPDPLGFADGPNLYAYVHNNPLIFVDSLGLFSEKLGELTYGPEASKVKPYPNYEEGRNQSRLFDLGQYGYFEYPNLGFGYNCGMYTSFDKALSDSFYLGDLAGGANIYSVYNATHGFWSDLNECRMNFKHVATPPVDRTEENWTNFFERSSKDAVFVSFCFSQGAIQVRNALMRYPVELRKRIVVVAIAPGCYIDENLCKEVRHYVAPSYRDFVPLFDLYGRFVNRKNVEVLKCHPEAEFWDHRFQSPTYRKPIESQIKRSMKLYGSQNV